VHVTQVVVVIGGGALQPYARSRADADAVVIAADSGLDHALAAGVRPSLLVGDLDSISESGRAWTTANALPVQQYPPDKDATDTELALAAALAVPGARRLLVLGGHDDADQRLDHLLGTLLALGHPDFGHLDEVSAVLGGTRIAVAHPGRRVEVPLAAGDTFSLLALHGGAEGITLKGAKWELDNASLAPHEARGVSNIANGAVTVECRSGVVTVVVP
jgi:thiamine pyrophosphokinase